MEHNLNKKELALIEKLREKYKHTDDELANNLEGLLHYQGLHYWDYIQLDALISLQHPKTDFDDETIFIVYHQITELYFKLIMHELEIFSSPQRKEYLEINNWIKRIGRVINYFDKITDSFNIMLPGEKYNPDQFFDKIEFSKFRLALMPASGFQTVSIRKIEMMSTSLHHLLVKERRHELKNETNLHTLYENLYWKKGGRIHGVYDHQNNLKKTRTLENFEKKYDTELLQFAEKYLNRNLWYLFFQHAEEELEQIREDEKIRVLLRDYDQKVNKVWKGNHLVSIMKQMSTEEYGTGGTNWREYLPPAKQDISYYPELNL